MSKVYKKMSIFLMLYIVIQPILDAVTGTMIHQGASSTITLGIAVRMAVMLLSVIYIIGSRKTLTQSQFKVLNIYVICLLIVIALNVCVSYMYKPVFSLVAEGSAISKMVYLLVMSVAYFIAFKDLLARNLIKKYFPRVIFYAIMLVDLVMIVAHFTHTNFNAYSYMKAGENGWFFAANEIGSLLAITLPMVVLFIVQQAKSLNKWYYWVGLFTTMYASILLGTKSGIISIFGTLTVGIVIALIQTIVTKNKSNVVLLIIFTLTTVGMIFVLPHISASQNVSIQKEYLKEQREKENKLEKLKNKKHLTQDEKDYLNGITPGQKELVENNEIKDTTKSLIFSSRTVYLNRINDYYKVAPTAQKVFGMGVGGNYLTIPKTSEMDFFDLFYEFGIVGFIVVIAPLVATLWYLLISVLRNWREIFNYQVALLLSSVLMAMVIAMLAGHVLMAPAVNIYLAIIVGFLLVKYQNKKN